MEGGGSGSGPASFRGPEPLPPPTEGTALPPPSLLSFLTLHPESPCSPVWDRSPPRGLIPGTEHQPGASQPGISPQGPGGGTWRMNRHVH